MIFAIISCFILSIFILCFGVHLKNIAFKYLAVFPFSLFLFFASFISSKVVDDGFLIKQEWIPSLGVSLDFQLDGLSLLFTLLITGIGTFIFLYASSYLKGHEFINRFYTYLTMFMGSMLGLVLSDNLLTLFIFWELTSITSFFLIGFDNNNEEARKSALLSLGITGLGGFFLLTGIIGLGVVAETYSIHELIAQKKLILNNPLYIYIVILIFIGAFTKSAQFPFHFWLPSAMKAPTPVSAYLHSATMVKAGIYLIARLSPSLGGTDIWNITLIVVGGFTMLYAAFHSIFKTDLKGILAYSTIASLGMMVFLLGLNNPYSIQAVSTFILVHALYKAALFMTTGAIDHSIHTRDITKLYGLKKILPFVGIAGVLAALSNAGIPLSFGFIGKDLIYESTLHSFENYAFLLTGIAVVTNILLLYSGFLAGIKPFTGNYKNQYKKFQAPDFWLYAPALILGILGIVFGVFPHLAQTLLIQPTANVIAGSPIAMNLKIFHGWNIVIALSAATIISGIILYLLLKPTHKKESFVHKFEAVSPQSISKKGIDYIKLFAYHYTKTLHNGYLRIYLLVIIAFMTLIVGFRLLTLVPLQINTDDLSEFRLYELVVFFAVVIATITAVVTHSRLTAIASLGIIGFCISLIFVFYGAPDLAMTQFTIDTLTVVLFVLVLFKLPGYIRKSKRVIQIRDAIVSGAFGTLIALITLQALVSPASKDISMFYARNAYILAKGKNVVNVILVDFRGFDTLVETIVLSIAAIGVYGLLKFKFTPK
ncbi:MAG TPA: hydrogen gas-evolving membrane-bound hydrogenase subunit E [Chitinophagales bacterium]|nr:hydrogen gas-evolving membrane-bound hydrogenase subunit E [Chitinophagales bacterium]